MKHLKLFLEYFKYNHVEPTGTVLHKSNPNDVKNAIKDIYKLGHTEFFGIHFFIEGAKVWINDNPGVTELEVKIYVQKKERHMGKATRIMKQICRIADYHGVYMITYPNAIMELEPENPNLSEGWDFEKGEFDEKAYTDWLYKLGFTNIVFKGSVAIFERAPNITQDKFDELLDKINTNGIKSLTPSELKMMNSFSGKTEHILKYDKDYVDSLPWGGVKYNIFEKFPDDIKQYYVNKYFDSYLSDSIFFNYLDDKMKLKYVNLRLNKNSATSLSDSIFKWCSPLLKVKYTNAMIPHCTDEMWNTYPEKLRNNYLKKILNEYIQYAHTFYDRFSDNLKIQYIEKMIERKDKYRLYSISDSINNLFEKFSKNLKIKYVTFIPKSRLTKSMRDFIKNKYS